MLDNENSAFVAMGSNLGDREENLREATLMLSRNKDIHIHKVSSLYLTEPMLTDGGFDGRGQNSEVRSMGLATKQLLPDGSSDIKEKGDYPWFINGVLDVRTCLGPYELLEVLLDVERSMGQENIKRNNPRVIDLDLLTFGWHVIEADGLNVPHPSMHLRRFVLVPLAEICPEFVHPILKRSISEILSSLDDDLKVVKIEEGLNIKNKKIVNCQSTIVN